MFSTQISQLTAGGTKLCLCFFLRVGHTSFFKFTASASLRVFSGINQGSVVDP